MQNHIWATYKDIWRFVSGHTGTHPPHYLNVRSVPLAVLPGRPHRREDPVGVVKLAALQRQEHRGEGLEPDHVVEDEGRGGVMSAVVERRNLKDV